MTEVIAELPTSWSVCCKLRCTVFIVQCEHGTCPKSDQAGILLAKNALEKIPAQPADHFDKIHIAQKLTRQESCLPKMPAQLLITLHH